MALRETGGPTYYLYWDMEDQGYFIGAKMNGRDEIFKTRKKGVQCPADANAAKSWEVVGLYNDDDPGMRAYCGTTMNVVYL